MQVYTFLPRSARFIPITAHPKPSVNSYAANLVRCSSARLNCAALRRLPSVSTTCKSAQQMTAKPPSLSRTSATLPTRPTWHSHGASSRTASQSAIRRRRPHRMQTAGRDCCWSPQARRYCTPDECSTPSCVPLITLANSCTTLPGACGHQPLRACCAGLRLLIVLPQARCATVAIQMLFQNVEACDGAPNPATLCLCLLTCSACTEEYVPFLLRRPAQHGLASQQHSCGRQGMGRASQRQCWSSEPSLQPMRRGQQRSVTSPSLLHQPLQRHHRRYTLRWLSCWLGALSESHPAWVLCSSIPVVSRICHTCVKRQP